MYGVWAARNAASILGHAEATSVNVHYYVREKHPERNAIRKPATQQNLGAIAHTNVTPRNDAVEKQNEIPGRQIPYEPEAVVPIRSAVHSNYAGMVAMLGTDNCLYLGKEERYYYEDIPRPYYDRKTLVVCRNCHRSIIHKK